MIFYLLDLSISERRWLVYPAIIFVLVVLLLFYSRIFMFLLGTYMLYLLKELTTPSLCNAPFYPTYMYEFIHVTGEHTLPYDSNSWKFVEICFMIQSMVNFYKYSLCVWGKKAFCTCRIGYSIRLILVIFFVILLFK